MDPNKSIEMKIDEKLEGNGSEKISMLLKDVPAVNNIFDVHKKVGEGTFSSVFLATLKNSSKAKKYAIKHLVPTCHPEKIERELDCLKKIGGKDNVVGLELCLRSIGSVVFVMPYMHHNRFSDYVNDMGPEELKDYMKALLIALRQVHKYNIIHRDVKPSNFLYDRKSRSYLLVDFGLAQQYNPNEKFVNRKSDKSDQIIRLTSHIQCIKRKRCDENKIDGTLKSVNKPELNKIDRTLKTANKPETDKCYCFGKPKVCSLCLMRAPQSAPRAGTPGFRAPEVLLKHPQQTSAIDVWAAGIMMLSILTATQSFFQSPDDMTALAEITSIFGSKAIEQYSRKIGKKVIFDTEIPGMDLITLCHRLRGRKKRPKNTTPNSIGEVLIEDNKQITYPEEAYQLLEKLLDIDHKTRTTAEKALNHPFFNS